jgi:hypothetical protein
MNEKRMPETVEAAVEPIDPSPEPAVPPQLQGILGDLQSPDANTRARAVRLLCPCRGVQWGVPVFPYVRKMLHDTNPIVRRAVRHDLNENPWWSERQETRPDLGPRPRTIKVTLAVKGTALGNLCEQLRADTDLPLVVDPGVARYKVTLFCRQMPLRDVLRQLGRLMDCSWDWTRSKGTYRYELRRDPPPTVSGEPCPSGRRTALKRERKTSLVTDRPNEARGNARLAHDRVLRQRVTVLPTADLELPGAATAAGSPSTESTVIGVTSADVLEAIHHAARLPVVAEFSAQRSPVAAVSARDQSLFAALNQVADAMGLRWQ